MTQNWGVCEVHNSLYPKGERCLYCEAFDSLLDIGYSPEEILAYLETEDGTIQPRPEWIPPSLAYTGSDNPVTLD